ncbi:hypothetical protein CMQ_8142 [Grosmannia clavigera kw1407]|uniref:Allergen asp f 4 n=1 Tax=Grosmannia clavigera (strain kw1407 / UAMH 11150) TaxID=655863 RepID=F0XL09_GROCL|nr:uncharacterized protein CMQ_8142 [Grosmannia clavigera kw1407]EFX01676.1 hypothetical protein CMQ_8142 [Grosmannia clavigera kw1407]
MRTSPLVLLAAVGASALPSHAHHRALHAKKDVSVTATIDGKVVSWMQGDSPFKLAYKPTTSATSTATSTSTSVASATPTTSSSSSISTSSSWSSSSSSTVVAASTSKSVSSSKTSSAAAAASTTAASTSTSTDSGSGLSVYSAFATCSSEKKRATMAEIAYTGNTGCDGYGSNIVLVQASIADKYDYTVKVVNDMSSTAQCKIWNKIGSDGKIDGFFTGFEAKTFTLKAGSSQYVAFDGNSQGGMCCSSGSIATTVAGEFLCPWLEFDFANTSNNEWSGFDASALVEGSAGGPYNALKVCTEDGSTCSSLDGTGSGTNAYLPGDEAADGIGGNIAAGSLSLIATWS